jgi:hypothetical protein
MNARGGVAIDFRAGRRLTLEFILINVLANKSLGGGLIGVAGCVSALLDIESGSDGWHPTTEAARASRVKNHCTCSASHSSVGAAQYHFSPSPWRFMPATPATQWKRNYKRELTAHVCHSLTCAAAPITANKKAGPQPMATQKVVFPLEDHTLNRIAELQIIKKSASKYWIKILKLCCLSREFRTFTIP